MNGFNCDEFADFAALTKSMPLDVRFIEFMPFADNDWSTKKFIPMDQILDKIREKHGDLEQIKNESPQSTSKGYKLKDSQGQIGVISSMSKHFCGGCNRIRLTADGNLKVCLFDNREVNLKQLIEREGGIEDSELEQVIR